MNANDLETEENPNPDWRKWQEICKSYPGCGSDSAFPEFLESVERTARDYYRWLYNNRVSLPRNFRDAGVKEDRIQKTGVDFQTNQPKYSLTIEQ